MVSCWKTKENGRRAAVRSNYVGHVISKVRIFVRTTGQRMRLIEEARVRMVIEKELLRYRKY